MEPVIREVYGTREVCAEALGYKADRIVYLWLDGSVRTMRANKERIFEKHVNAARSANRLKSKIRAIGDRCRQVIAS